jgi:hypothetical protein
MTTQNQTGLQSSATGEARESSEHRFGFGDFLSADDYAIGSEVSIKILEYIGRQEYTGKDGKPRSAGMYMAQTDSVGIPQQWRLGIKNEKVAYHRFHIRSYEELVGRTLVLKVAKFAMGNGFMLMNIK